MHKMRLLWALLLLASGSSMMAPAAAVTTLSGEVGLPLGDPPPKDPPPKDPPPKDPPPRIDLDVRLTLEGLDVRLYGEQSVSCLQSDCLKVKIWGEVDHKLRWRDIPRRPNADVPLPPGMFDPYVLLGLTGRYAPYDLPSWELTGGALLGGRISDLQDGNKVPLGGYARINYHTGLVTFWAGADLGYRPNKDRDDIIRPLRMEIGGVGVATGIEIGWKFADAMTPFADALASFDLNITQMYVLARSCVPEPSSWALMLAGFGFIGAALRRARITSPPSPA